MATPFVLDTYSNFSLRKNLAHLVEQLSVKQCVVGSSPTIFSFVSSIWDGGVHGWRAGLKNRERWFDSTPSHHKTRKRGSTQTPYSWFLLFVFMPPHKNKCVVWLRDAYPFYICSIYRNKNYYYSGEFLHLGSVGFVFYSAISHILIWRGTQVAKGDPLLRG